MTINELHKLACAGDGKAQNRLFQQLSDSFRIFAQHKLWNRSDTEEIVQEALMTITAKYKDIEFEISFSAWAYRVLENKILSFSRTKAGRTAKDKRIRENIDVADRWTPDPLIQVKLRKCLRAVSEYGNHYARVICLGYAGFDTDEICRRLKTTKGNVYNLLSRARQMLRKCLEKGEIK